MNTTRTQKLCECGCGLPAPVAPRNWHSKGIKKGEPLRFVCGHHRRGKEQSMGEKAKRVKTWGVNEFTISPYLPGNRVVRYYKDQKRWYCSMGKSRSKKPHARAVYEHHFGKVPSGWVVHHKSGKADTIADDKPENLVAVPKVWNLRYFSWLARGFNVPESVVTECYLQVADHHRQDLFREVCRLLLERTTNA